MTALERFAKIVASIEQTDEVISTHRGPGDSVFLEVSTGDGRSQVVMIKLVEEGGFAMVHMMSEIGPAVEELCADMLRRNLNFCYARVAIVENAAGGGSFAVVYTYPFDELEAVEFAKAFGEVAFMADGIERDVFEVDRV